MGACNAYLKFEKEENVLEKILITRKEAAQALSISVDTLDQLRQAGKIRCATIGARVYFSPEELTAFVKKEGAMC